jgi:putative transposase
MPRGLGPSLGARRRTAGSQSCCTPRSRVAAGTTGVRASAERPNQRWVGDTSELRIGEQGKAYLAVVLDLYSRFVVGWAISAVNDRHLTIKALEMALKRRCAGLGLFHHSNQGSTYASEDYQDALSAYGIMCSMSRRGNCYDKCGHGGVLLDRQERDRRAVR